MNKKILVLLVVVIAVAIGVFCVRQRTLGNINQNITEVKTSNADITFKGNAGDRIKISLRTTVNSGTVDFVISDSQGNIVAELDRAKALETYVDLSKDDTYALTAIYKDFTGKFSVKVSEKRF